MTEFRFFEEEKAYPYSNARIRYLLKAVRKLDDHWSIHLFDEIHMNVGRNIVLNTFDQNRLGGGVTYALSDQLSFGATYFNWYQQASNGSDFILRDIVQFSFNQTIKP